MEILYISLATVSPKTKVGYNTSLIFFRYLSLFVNNAIVFFNHLINWFINFIPDPNFLTDIITFEAGIIAVAIPISFSIVSSISDNYESRAIIKNFKNEMMVVVLPWIAIGIATLSVLMRFLYHDGVKGSNWLIWNWTSKILIVCFVLGTIIFFRFLIILKNYISDSNFIADKLAREVEKFVKR